MRETFTPGSRKEKILPTKNGNLTKQNQTQATESKWTLTPKKEKKNGIEED